MSQTACLASYNFYRDNEVGKGDEEDEKCTHMNLSVGWANSGGCQTTVRVVAVLASSTML